MDEIKLSRLLQAIDRSSNGNTGGFTTIATSTPVLSVAGAYATGDYMGTTTTPQAFSDVVRKVGGTGIIKSIAISDKYRASVVACIL